ncbi:MAG: hypothetical protein LAO78_18630 [Acidobacteriia bacterium]|nr:hypothetical protein [Terriglobia bacterium]
MTTVATPRKSRLGCLTQLVLAAILGVGVFIGVVAVTAPWGFFMGGRFHLIPQWQGLGRLHSNTAGGDYVLYIFFSPKSGKGLGTTHVSGNGLLCTPRGETFYLSVGGDFEKNIKTDTNGKTANFYMSNRSVASQFSGNRKPSLELRGKWVNPDLVMDDHGSIARNFEPDGKLYTGHSLGRPYMAEVVPVTLHEGSKSEFESACAAAKTR